MPDLPPLGPILRPTTPPPGEGPPLAAAESTATAGGAAGGGPSARLAPLFHHRWSLPLLAALQRAGGGARFVELRHALALAPESLRLALDHLLARRLVARNPGYGHPLRPEYVLTPAGTAAAAEAVPFFEVVARLDAAALARRKWPMPVVHGIGHGASRFGEVQGVLEVVTPRALTAALRALGEARLVARRVEAAAWPPAVRYELSEPARGLLLPTLDRLAALELAADGATAAGEVAGA